MTWPATRAAGLARLASFLPRAGSAYQSLRNHDFGPADRGNVSQLSPYLRHRLVREEDVLRAVLQRYAPGTVEKFVQEVFWRGYWKGWLEHHPDAWTAYRTATARDLSRLAADDDLALRYQAAVSGETGIELFDAWAQELVESGYLHNHARMWFASIWLFTLELPWTLGADWFLRHLLDGDPASNTLSWRWVAGLHTRGKHYLARPDNIARYAARRFDTPDVSPAGLERLAGDPEPLVESHPPAAIEPTWPAPCGDPGRHALLLGEDDLGLDVAGAPAAVAALPGQPRSPLPTGSAAAAFTDAALADGLARAAVCFDLAAPPRRLQPPEVAQWARDSGVDRVVMAYAPVGPGQDLQRTVRAELAAAGLEFQVFLRDFDRMTWPHAGRGYFQLRKRIPELLQALGV